MTHPELPVDPPSELDTEPVVDFEQVDVVRAAEAVLVAAERYATEDRPWFVEQVCERLQEEMAR